MNTITQDILNEIKILENAIKQKRTYLRFIRLHPNLSYSKMEKIKNWLLNNGWIVYRHMVAYESYHGYGMDLVKATELLNEKDKKFLKKHEDGYVY